MNNSIIDPVVAAIGGAAAKYGSDLLSPTAPDGADDALRLARNVVSRLRISPEHGAGIVAAIGDAIASGDAASRNDGLRAAVSAALEQDADLASDLAMMLS